MPRFLLIVGSIIAAVLIASCDFSRPAGQSAWSASVPPPIDLSARTVVEVRAPAGAGVPTAVVVPPSPWSEPAAVLRPETAATEPPVVVVEPPVTIAVRAPPNPFATGSAPAAAPVALLPPAIAGAAIDRVRLDGRLYRTFGELGQLGLGRLAVLARTETATIPGYCAWEGDPGLYIRGGSGICLYDRDHDRLLETMAVLGRPDLGFMETGPFAYSPAAE